MKWSYTFRLCSFVGLLSACAMLANGPAWSAEQMTGCQGFKVVELRTSRLALYSTHSGNPERLSKDATKDFAKTLPLDILACKKGMVQVRTAAGQIWWLKDYHIEPDRPLTTFRIAPSAPGYSGPRLGGSRGYGSTE